MQGFTAASITAQSHQLLDAQKSPWMPTITLAELATWTMPAWRATGTETIETTEQGSR